MIALQSSAQLDPALAIYGQELTARLRWLESVVGVRGRGKFEHAKLDSGVFAGQYVSGVIDSEQGRKVVCDLVDQLRAGHVAKLCDINSYYRHGKRRPAGMIVQGDALIDVWPSPDPVA
jgi:hypothetical protein